MKGLFRCDNNGFGNPTIGRMPPCAFDGRFVGFCTGVTEKGLVGDTIPRQPIGESGLSGNEVEIGYVMDGLELGRDSLGQGRIGVAQGTRGNARNAIEILLAIGSV